MEQVLILVESGKIKSFCEERPRSKAFISLHAWQKQFINCNFASMGKKDGSTSACYLWRFTEVWEMLMWLTFIYNMFRNGPRVHVLPLRLSFRTPVGETGGKKAIPNLLCSARTQDLFIYLFFPVAAAAVVVVGGCASVTLVEDFFHPTVPSPL